MDNVHEQLNDAQDRVERGLTSEEKDDVHNYESLRKRFWVQVAMTATVTTFCITMIAVEGKEGVYLPILTGLVGYWLPAPDSRIRRSSALK